ncbi:uncharacterized protein LOC136076194 [Hydra vulgaris]|uniref:Uncharacterized protein LOC136076194 n=1 Tax=Hydra vulgaris TaxID=6087 RepID=A0ABM4BA23_HYDVU
MPIVDNGIESIEFHENELAARTNLNDAGEIRTNIEQLDLFTLSSEAYLLIEGQLVKADGTAYAYTDAVTLTNNGIMYLFSEISYQLSNQNIETIYHPRRATTMLGMLKYPNDFQLAQGLNQLWYKNNTTTAVLADNPGFSMRQSYIIRKPTTKVSFSFCIPLRHIFGFCEDYDRVIYGFKHTINLKRDSDAIFELAGIVLGKVNLNKISLLIPHVIPSDAKRISLYKSIESKMAIPVSFRARQCDTIPVAQANSFFWRLSVKLNQERYPVVDYNLSFPNQQFSKAYRDAAVFNEKFYGMNELITHSNITPSDYKDLYPLFVFDVSKQSERLKSSTLDVQVKATFNSAVPAVTDAYAVVLSDRIIQFQSNGNKMNVAY